MSSDRDLGGADTGGTFHTVQPLRDLESNWAVDLAKNLEEYLLKICSGEITGDDEGHLSVNFAEAALLLQGSVQVYSRKVEYLYTLVLHALEFISQKRQHDQPADASIHTEASGSHTVPDDENDNFWVSDDIPVEAKNSLDTGTCRDVQLNQLVKPPANLVVLEGECLDAAGDGGELESYLLATNDLYQDFILLDPCDALAVNDYCKDDKASKGQDGVCRGSSVNSKSRKGVQSPNYRSGGSGRKSTAGKNNVNLNPSPLADLGCRFNDCNNGPDPDVHGFGMNDGHLETGEFGDLSDSDDDNDPWKPLNPHESGNLRVKPFRKVKYFRRKVINSTKQIALTTQFPLARVHGTIDPQPTEVWEAQREREPGSPPLYEKLRQSLVHRGQETCEVFFDPKGENEDNGLDNSGFDFDPPDFDMPEGAYEYEEVPLHTEKHDDGGACFNANETYGHGDPSSQASLDELCQSHLDALLASIAENEKQTELAARVSTWKQRIEKNLDEQDSHPPFDIHEYGERILDKLSLEASGRDTMSFSEVVRGQQKHDVARTFSALLQLVNDRNVDLERGNPDSEFICFTATNPFYVQLLNHEKRQQGMQLRSAKKRAKSPIKKTTTKSHRVKSEREKCTAASSSPSGPTSMIISPPLNCKFSVKLAKVNSIRCTPEGKRRRRSQLVEPP